MSPCPFVLSQAFNWSLHTFSQFCNCVTQMLLTDVPPEAHSLYSLLQSPTAEALTAGALCVVLAGTIVRWPDVEMQTPLPEY